MSLPLSALLSQAGLRIGSGLRFRITSFNAVKDYLRQLPDESIEDVKKIFEKNAKEVYDKLVTRTENYPLKKRSGALQKSLRYGVTGNTMSTVRGFVSTTSPYARIHESGGTIRAKNRYLWLRGGPYMNIPTKQNVQPNGLPTLTSRQLFSTGGTVKVGNEGFGLYRGNTKMFHLAKSVSLKARFGFRDTGRQQLPQLLDDLKKLYLARGGQ